MVKLNLAVLVSGRGTNLQAIIDAIEVGKLDAEITVVISDKPAAPALDRARQHGIPAIVVRPKEYANKQDYEAAVLKHLEAANAELIVLAGYMRLVGPTLLAAYKYRIMNIHPALLPAFPGLDAQQQALDYGVKVTGCTVHFVDDGMDTGPIILQAAVPVIDSDTVETLAARILELEHQLYPRAIALYAAGRLNIAGRRVMISE